MHACNARLVSSSAAVSISSWPVRKTKMSPGRGWEMWICGGLGGRLVGGSGFLCFFILLFHRRTRVSVRDVDLCELVDFMGWGLVTWLRRQFF